MGGQNGVLGILQRETEVGIHAESIERRVFSLIYYEYNLLTCTHVQHDVKLFETVKCILYDRPVEHRKSASAQEINVAACAMITLWEALLGCTPPTPPRCAPSEPCVRPRHITAPR